MKDRRGIALIETMIALSVLVIMMTTFARFMADFQKGTGRAATLTLATEIAKERLELVRADPRYGTLVTRFGAGAGADTVGFPGFPSMRRLTRVVRDQTGAPARDFTTVTVQVTAPGMPDTVRLSSVMARP